MEPLHPEQVAFHRDDQYIGKYCGAILVPFAVPDYDLSHFKINILDSEAEAFCQA